MSDYQSFTDEHLVNKVRSENQELYRHIVDRYQARLMRYVNHLVFNEHKAADIVQETFLKAFINLKGFDTKKKFSSWIYRIAHNEAINSLKKHHREFPLIPELDLPSSENIEEEYTKKELIQKIQNCLTHLPILYSEPLALYYLEAKSYTEISDILRLPISTIGTRISRAKGLMKIICKNQK